MAYWNIIAPLKIWYIYGIGSVLALSHNNYINETLLIIDELYYERE